MTAKVGNEEFNRDVLEGLRRNPKRLSSKYFYDAQGDQLFQQITELPEYYLTRAENEILETHGPDLAQRVKGSGRKIQLIELGPGDGSKTSILFKFLPIDNCTYVPIDISENALQIIGERFRRVYSDLKIEPLQAGYEKALSGIKSHNPGNIRVFLFLGSNIGNLDDSAARELIVRIAQSMSHGDMLLLGLDKKKDPARILEAYNDRTGITAAFNINLLKRINRELGANFNLEAFQHYASYDPVMGEARSYLISMEDQSVFFPHGGQSIPLRKFEPIQTESSWKYDEQRIDTLIEGSNLVRVVNYTDSKELFLDVLFEKT